MNDFYAGQDNIEIIFISQTERIRATENVKIKVVMEYGQMAGVPWFEVSENGVPISKWNAALCQGVKLSPPKPKEAA